MREFDVQESLDTGNSPDKSEGAHAHRLQIRVSDVAVSPRCTPPMRE